MTLDRQVFKSFSDTVLEKVRDEDSTRRKDNDTKDPEAIDNAPDRGPTTE